MRVHAPLLRPETPAMTDPATVANPETDAALEADRVRYEITRVPADHFLYGPYRYTSLKDAIAQAKRDEAAKEA
jgi:hypothetical protein